ncbi:MAG: hypothetical protein KGK16_05805 [Bradyrhizobium sp.]|nr:hypothetical protein [Bradyrhizobium sp.]
MPNLQQFQAEFLTLPGDDPLRALERFGGQEPPRRNRDRRERAALELSQIGHGGGIAEAFPTTGESTDTLVRIAFALAAA